MKILLVSANRFVIPYPVYPLGISYIATFLRKKIPQAQIKIFDINIATVEDLSNFVKEYNPNYTAVSLRNIDDVNTFSKESFISGYKEIIDTIKNQCNTKLFIGGCGYSIFPELLFDYLTPDFGIKGEGEESIVKLINALENKTDYKEIEGLVYSDNGKTTLNGRTAYSHSLELEFEPALVDHYWKHSGMLNIQTKRGCPYDCVYCTYPLIEGKTVRTLDTDSIVYTLKKLYHTKGIDYVFFTDSVFNMYNDYNIELAEKIIDSGIKVKWGAYFSLNNLTEDMLKLLKRAGLEHVEFGTETISEQQLKNYHKHFTVADVLEKSELCNKVGVAFAHFLILGGLGETDATIDETLANAAKINNTVFFPFIGMRIYPNTPLQQIAIKEGKISVEDNLLEPKYYISDKFDMNILKEKAAKTNKRWIFPDDDLSAVMTKMRTKNKKGPLWEYLIR